MGNLGRRLLLKVTITDPDKAAWIWGHYLNPSVGEDELGIRIGRIADYPTYQIMCPEDIEDGCSNCACNYCYNKYAAERE